MIVPPLNVTVGYPDCFLPTNKPSMKLRIANEGSEEARLEAADQDTAGDRSSVDAEWAVAFVLTVDSVDDCRQCKLWDREHYRPVAIVVRKHEDKASWLAD